MPADHIAEARMTSKGQVTLPKKVKEMLGAEEGDYIMFFKEDNRIFIGVGKLMAKGKTR